MNLLEDEERAREQASYEAEAADRKTQRDRREFWKGCVKTMLVEGKYSDVISSADNALDAYDERCKDGRL
jgi:hypothetical protein